MSILNKMNGFLLETDKPVKIILTHLETGEPLVDNEKGEPAYVEVLSLDSDIARAHTRALEARRAKMKTKQPDAAALDADMIELIVKLSRGWRLVNYHGDLIDVEFTPANARELYSDNGARWLVDQVMIGITSRQNFLPQATTTKS